MAQGGGGLANLDFDDSDCLSDGYIDTMQQDIIAMDDKDDECIMCCCRPHEEHDESMKFTIKVSPEHVNYKNGEGILEQTLFKKQPLGELLDYDEKQGRVARKISAFVDKRMITGRH